MRKTPIGNFRSQQKFKVLEHGTNKKYNITNKKYNIKKKMETAERSESPIKDPFSSSFLFFSIIWRFSSLFEESAQAPVFSFSVFLFFLPSFFLRFSRLSSRMYFGCLEDYCNLYFWKGLCSSVYREQIIQHL